MASRILIIEDDADTAEVLREFLQDEGFQVQLASTGKDAMQRFKKRPFDLLIADLRLPDMDGREVVSACAESVQTRLSVVFLSGARLRETWAAAPPKVRFLLLEKPCRPKTILAAVRKLL
ncbi:MAG: response regulator [Calditrichaeota bacterium]|nr:MAG: response regulator [Calditrichota bacterium]